MSEGDNKVIEVVSQELGILLGVLYKGKKDVFNAKCMDFIGYELSITSIGVVIRGKAKSRDKVKALIGQLLTAEITTFDIVEKLMGIITHISTANKLWRIESSMLYCKLDSAYAMITEGM